MRGFALNMLVGLACVTLASCDSGPGPQTLHDEENNTSVLTLSAPLFIRQVQTIDSTTLILDVTVNGTTVDMSKQGDEWTGIILVPAVDITDIELLWSEKTHKPEPLKLAVYRDTSGPITTAALLPLSADDYDTAEFDDDNDKVSNFDERRHGSDPFDASDTGTTIPDSGTPPQADTENPDVNDPAAENDANPEETTDTNEGNTPVDIIVNQIDPSDSPIIDGVLEDVWSTAANWSDYDGMTLAIDNLIWGSDDSRANDATEFQWVAMHDGTYLYLLVIGEYAENTTQFADSEQVWHDDTIELYIDGDNSKGTSYDGVNDYLLFIPHLKYKQPLEANNIHEADHRKYSGSDIEASGTWPAGVEFVNRISTGHRHTWEIRIELSRVGIQVGQPFGIDLQYSDDQDGGERDAKWSWMSADDNTWHNPGLMGTAILGGDAPLATNDATETDDDTPLVDDTTESEDTRPPGNNTTENDDETPLADDTTESEDTGPPGNNTPENDDDTPLADDTTESEDTGPFGNDVANTTVDVMIKRIDPSRSPVIDGQLDDIWSSGASRMNQDGMPLAIDNLIGGK